MGALWSYFFFSTSALCTTGLTSGLCATGLALGFGLGATMCLNHLFDVMNRPSWPCVAVPWAPMWETWPRWGSSLMWGSVSPSGLASRSGSETASGSALRPVRS